MSDIFDYLAWRGDISFNDLGMCEADYVVFCALSYMPFDTFTDSRFDDICVLSDVIGRISSAAVPCDQQKNRRTSKRDASGEAQAPALEYFNKGDDRLAELILTSPRFGDVKLCGFVNKLDTKKQEQFCAMTFILPGGEAVVTFRGTDHTLVGWKEDFNMGFMSELPSQKDAVKYLNSAAAAFPDAGLYVCGHSKGGNLAMYSSFFCTKKVQKRIIGVRNLDGPGFMEEVLAKDGPRGVIGRTKTYVPQSSVVGMLLSHEEPYHVVHSTNFALMQHHLSSWEISRGEPVEDEGTTESSQLIDATLKQWVSEMPIEQRSRLIDGLYEVASGADADTLEELATGRSTLAMIKTMGRMDDETKKLIRAAYKLFKKSLRQAAPIGKLFSSSEPGTAAGRTK